MGLAPVTAAMLTIPATFAVVIAAAVAFDRTFDHWGIRLAARVFPAQPSRGITVAVVRRAGGLHRRVHYQRRRALQSVKSAWTGK